MIEFQYFRDCPNAAATLENLRALLRDSGFPDSDLRITEVSSPDAASEVSFQGSPTILVDGIDIGTGRPPQGFRYSCRLYQIDGRSTGTLSGD